VTYHDEMGTEKLHVIRADISWNDILITVGHQLIDESTEDEMREPLDNLVFRNGRKA
jgi:hypothetical protein